jgi:hypothetical protein
MYSSYVSLIRSECKVDITLALLRCLLGCSRFEVRVDYAEGTEEESMERLQLVVGQLSNRPDVRRDGRIFQCFYMSEGRSQLLR